MLWRFVASGVRMPAFLFLAFMLPLTKRVVPLMACWLHPSVLSCFPPAACGNTCSLNHFSTIAQSPYESPYISLGAFFSQLIGSFLSLREVPASVCDPLRSDAPAEICMQWVSIVCLQLRWCDIRVTGARHRHPDRVPASNWGQAASRFWELWSQGKTFLANVCCCGLQGQVGL